MDWGDAPTWAGSAVSIGGAVIAVWAAGSSRRSANADERMAEHEHTPVFTALVEDVNGSDTGTGGWQRLALQLVEPLDLDEVRVELLTAGVMFPDSQDGVEVGAPRGSAVHSPGGVVTGLAVGDRARWRVDFADMEVGPDAVPPIGEVELRVTAKAGRSSWRVLVKAEVEAVRKQREWQAAIGKMTTGQRYTRRL
ncbi:hypothetical protein ACIA5C_19890 [Actinoplanes sp. NPDC051343]|uniref:hypothetical protein n=1 Tax=Actinoplanes sp. NPDC051343 TaxID=3363906 RepID=UPI0037BB0705